MTQRANSAEDVISKALAIAQSYVGIREVGNNRGKEVDEIQRYFGMLGQPYCTMFALYAYVRACLVYNVRFPMPRTASSQTLHEWAESKKFTYKDPALILPGDIGTYRKGDLHLGHTVLITSALGKGFAFQTIEGNAQPDTKHGDQRQGQGFYAHTRYANKEAFDPDEFFLRGFISIRKVFEGTVFA